MSRRPAAGSPSPASPATALGGPQPWRLARWALLAVAVGYGILGRVRYFDWCLHDDAFISFRYARNLARGHGLVMNPGERVEGITNLLWTLLAAPVIAAGQDPARAAQFAGAVLALALMVGAFVFTERRLGGGWYSLVTPAAFAFNLAYMMESLSGLETLLFTALVFAAYVAFLEERRDGTRRPGLWAACCGVATLVRPEGMLVFALLAAYAGFGVWRGESSARLRRAAAVYTILVVPLFVWRFAYYGAWLPNTFYTKVGYTSAQLARGWRFLVYTVAFTITGPVLLAAGVMSAVALARPLRVPAAPVPVASWTRLLTGRPRDEALAVACLLTAAYLLYVLLVGGDYEPTARFYLPVLGLLYLLFQEALRTLVLLFADAGRAVRALALAAVLAGGSLALARSEDHFLQVLEQRGWPQARRQHHEQLRAIGEWLHDNTPPACVIAVSSIGALPYYADRPILDMMGLTDRHIGRRRVAGMGHGPAGHEKGDGAYVLSRHPDLIFFDKGQLFAKEVGPEEVRAGARGVSELEIAASPDFARDYELRSSDLPVGHLYYYVRVR